MVNPNNMWQSFRVIFKSKYKPITYPNQETTKEIFIPVVAGSITLPHVAMGQFFQKKINL